MLRAVIVDDEAPARERLAALLAVHADITIVGEAADVEPAAEVCQRLAPDIVFLDVQLRSGTGFDLLPRLSGSPVVVFVSAYAEHAARASEVHAFEFLLKPIHPQQLAKTIARATQR
jgi:two-component system LytT family response regulator